MSETDRASGERGLVTLVVGEIGRSSSARSRGRPPGAGAVARSGKAAPGGSEDGDGGSAAPKTRQWSTLWAGEAPGEVRTGCEGEPELSLALTPDDARLVIEGTLAPSVAFMQGRLKTSGDNGLLLELLAWTTTPAFGEALAKWRREASVLDAGRGQG